MGFNFNVFLGLQIGNGPSVTAALQQAQQVLRKVFAPPFTWIKNPYSLAL